MIIVFIQMVFMTMMFISMGLLCGTNAADKKMVAEDTGKRIIWFRVSALKKTSFVAMCGCISAGLIVSLFLPEVEMTPGGTCALLAEFAACVIIFFFIGRQKARKTADARRVVVDFGNAGEWKKEKIRMTIWRGWILLVPSIVGGVVFTLLRNYFPAAAFLFGVVVIIVGNIALNKKLKKS